MKKRILYIFVFLGFSGLQVNAQQNYVHTILNESYVDLVNPVYLNGPDSIASAYYVNADLLFPAFGAFADFNIRPSVPSNGAYVTRFGYLAVYESPGFAHTDIFHGYYNPGLKYRDANSSIAVQLTGTTGNKLLKFQWKNLGIENHASNEFVNFQIWFDEASKTVNYHYGPSNMVTDSQDVGVFSIFRANNGFTELTHATNLYGDASQPGQLQVKNPTSFSGLYSAFNFPPSGTVITFAFPSTGLLDNTAKGTLSIFPNPFNETIHLQVDGIFEWELIDMFGKKVMHGESERLINTSEVASGVYFMKVTKEGREVIQKLVK